MESLAGCGGEEGVVLIGVVVQDWCVLTCRVTTDCHMGCSRPYHVYGCFSFDVAAPSFILGCCRHM